MKLHYIKLIILNYFRLVLITAVIGKLLYADTFYAYVLSFCKYWGINKVIYDLGIDPSLMSTVVYIIIQTIEAYLIYTSFKNKKQFVSGVSYLFVFFLLITSIAVMYNITGDCGCFGQIIEFTNSIEKIYFIVATLLLAGLYMLLDFKQTKPNQDLKLEIN